MRVVDVGNLGLTTPDGVDRVDITLGIILQAWKARVDDPFAVWRIGKIELVLVVVGELDLIPSAGVDSVDLGVVSGVAHNS